MLFLSFFAIISLILVGADVVVLNVATSTEEVLWSIASWSPHAPQAGDDVAIDLSSSTTPHCTYLVLDVPVHGSFRSFNLTTLDAAISGCYSALTVGDNLTLSAESVLIGQYSKVTVGWNASIASSTFNLEANAVIAGQGTVQASQLATLEGWIYPGAPPFVGCKELWPGAAGTSVYGDLTFTGSAFLSNTSQFFLLVDGGVQPPNRLQPGLPYSTVAFQTLSVDGPQIELYASASPNLSNVSFITWQIVVGFIAPFKVVVVSSGASCLGPPAALPSQICSCVKPPIIGPGGTETVSGEAQANPATACTEGSATALSLVLNSPCSAPGAGICSPVCDVQHGTCVQQLSYCLCADGWSGATCSTPVLSSVGEGTSAASLGSSSSSSITSTVSSSTNAPGLGPGAIAGIAVACGVGGIAVVAVMTGMLKHRRDQRKALHQAQTILATMSRAP